MLQWISGKFSDVLLQPKRRSSGSKIGPDNHEDAALVILREVEEQGADYGVVLDGGDIVKQKISVHYVVNNVYYSAPVRVSKITNKAKHESYIWIELDERTIDVQAQSGGLAADTDWEKHKRSFPPGVSVDKVGNVYIGESGEKISGDDVWASFEAPKRPKKPPKAQIEGSDALLVKFALVIGLVTHYEVQYMVVDSENLALDPRLRTARSWESLGHVSAKMREIEVNNIQCGVQYVFRVRAHNSLGWGPFSVASEPINTLPEAPSQPQPPFIQQPAGLRDDKLVLEWRCPKSNGSEILSFKVMGGAVQEEAVNEVFDGQALYVRLLHLKPSTAYHYKVQAFNQIGNSPWSEYMTIRTHPAKKAESKEGHYISDWVEVLSWGSEGALSYLNIDSGAETNDRPAAIDGPIDPLVEFKKKRFRFNAELLRNIPKGPRNVWRLNIDRANSLVDSMQKVNAVTDHEMLRKRIKVEYNGEEGIDAGGIAKEWFLQLSHSLFADETGLFKRSESEAGGVDICLAPAGPPDADGTLDDWFFFAGRLLGKAILDRQLVDIKFSQTLFKQIFGLHVDIDDLREVDPTLVKSMLWMLDNDIDGIIFEEFCVTVDPPAHAPNQEQVIVDLIPGGRNIEVTNENKEDYVEKLLKWRAVDSCKPYIDAMRRGLFEIVPEELLREAQFELGELEMLWSGMPVIDIQEIRNQCIFQGGFDANSPAVHWFWSLFKEINSDDQALLLRFITGTSKVPFDGFSPPFNLTLNKDLETHALCKAHACFNQIVLPDYATEAILREKVLFAIRNTEGFLLG